MDPGNIKKMAGTLVHRGPDDEGYFIRDAVGLGFRRLSIIDLAGGHQPMPDREQVVWVVFNSEIFNFPELKTTLENLGHVFKTKSDTEVIVHGYKQWGLEVFDHLNGMFGLAIWDERNKRLVLARDRMGIKPLYYKFEQGRLFFASEMRALVALAHQKSELDPAALNLFLRYRYTPAPFTLVQGIKKLAPGTRLVVEGDCARRERWWHDEPVPFDPLPPIHEAEEKLLLLYQRAVKRQLMSDVPVGLLLSGGLDSGLLLALMTQEGNAWKTYTAGFGDQFRDTDELGGFQFLEIRSSLPEELLMYTDKLSMAHGLEARVPYLDQEVVAYVERLPASFKVRLGSRKWLHRRVCRSFLPKKIVRRKKLGFQTPVDQWFRESLTGRMHETLLDAEALIFKYLQPRAVQRLVKDHQNGRCNHAKTLFSLVVLEQWLRYYLS